MIDLETLTIEKAHKDMFDGKYTACDLATAYLSRIKEIDIDISAYREVYDDVLSQADEADKMFREGKANILTGIPIAIKDNMLREGFIASASSRILSNYKASYNSTVIAELKKQGVVFLGRTNMDEFAMGSSTENSAYGVTKNPYNKDFVPGGSSGGSAAAVAMNGALASLGSDTGGSIRQPASFCGLVGLKTTYGAVSRYGLIAMASSLDQIGPFAKNVSDAEILFNAISGYDVLDSTTVSNDKRVCDSKLKKKIGVPMDFLKGDGIDEEVKLNFEKSCEALKSCGYEIVDVPLPLLKYALAVYYILMPAEVSSNLARLDGIRYGVQAEGDNLLSVYQKSRSEGFGKETKRRILLGTYILSHGYYDAYYNKANKVKDKITKSLEQAFLSVDVIMTPTSPFPPFKIGEKANDPLAMYLSDLFTVPANIAGIPAISIPSGKTKNGLPLGVHFMAPRFGENILFSIGKDFENI